MKIFGYELKKIVPHVPTKKENDDTNARAVSTFVYSEVKRMLRDEIDYHELLVSSSGGSRFVIRITQKPGLF